MNKHLYINLRGKKYSKILNLKYFDKIEISEKSNR